MKTGFDYKIYNLKIVNSILKNVSKLNTTLISIYLNATTLWCLHNQSLPQVCLAVIASPSSVWTWPGSINHMSCHHKKQKLVYGNEDCLQTMHSNQETQQYPTNRYLIEDP